MDKDKIISPTSKDSGQFHVSVLMSYRETQNNKWSDGQWEVSGLVVGERAESQNSHKLSKQALRSDVKNPQILWSGFTVSLYRDDTESYYQNLTSDSPRAFIVCRTDETDNEQLKPILVTLSYAEATSYMEVDELVYSVDMPPELYKWVEQFVLENYIPEKKRKRRRESWKETSEREAIK